MSRVNLPTQNGVLCCVVHGYLAAHVFIRVLAFLGSLQSDALGNLTKALEIADKHLDIATMIDPEGMCRFYLAVFSAKVVSTVVPTPYLLIYFGILRAVLFPLVHRYRGHGKAG